jgi:hypothetical protein
VRRQSVSTPHVSAVLPACDGFAILTRPDLEARVVRGAGSISASNGHDRRSECCDGRELKKSKKMSKTVSLNGHFDLPLE